MFLRPIGFEDLDYYEREFHIAEFFFLGDGRSHVSKTWQVGATLSNEMQV